MTPDELAAAKERANQKRRLRRLWVSDASWDEVCEEMGLEPESLRAFAATLGLYDRPDPDIYLPTPQEIKVAAANIRMGWSQAEREARLEGRLHDRMDNATRSDNDAG
jgi:hypothetical protein